MNSYKGLILPIIALIALVLKNVLGIDLPEELQNSIANTISDLVAIGLVLIGIVRNNVKKRE